MSQLKIENSFYIFKMKMERYRLRWQRITQNYGKFIEKNHEGQQSPGNQVSFSVFFYFLNVASSLASIFICIQFGDMFVENYAKFRFLSGIPLYF
jgi:hypothetical protein